MIPLKAMCRPCYKFTSLFSSLRLVATHIFFLAFLCLYQKRRDRVGPRYATNLITYRYPVSRSPHFDFLSSYSMLLPRFYTFFFLVFNIFKAEISIVFKRRYSSVKGLGVECAAAGKVQWRSRAAVWIEWLNFEGEHRLDRGRHYHHHRCCCCFWCQICYCSSEWRPRQWVACVYVESTTRKNKNPGD